VGGSHLYVDALINNYDLNESNERTNEFTNLSNDELKNELSKFNIVLANKIGSNRKRLIRALQIMKSGHKIDSKNKSFYGPLYIFCNKPRNQLYEDINKRVDLMIKNG
jgi:tRNA A37 N6-isopentenylltransferase MiaA